MMTSLRFARNRLLNTLRSLEGDAQLLHAATHYALLSTSTLPQWLDAERLNAILEEQDQAKTLQQQAKDDARWLKNTGYAEAWESCWTKIEPHLRWRLLHPESPDKYLFWQNITKAIMQFGIMVGNVDDEPLPTPFPFVPNPKASLMEMGDLWVSLGDEPAILRTGLEWAEQGELMTIFQQELSLASFTPINVDLLWRETCRRLAITPGLWTQNDVAYWPIRKIIGLFGDGYTSTGVVAMMDNAEFLLQDIHKVGGKRIISIFENNRQHRFQANADNSWEQDETGWMDVCVRGALINAMTDGGSLLVEKVRPLRLAAPIKEVYAAALVDRQWDWLSEKECRAVHTYSYDTGERMQRDPGHIYRGFHEQFKTA